MIFIIFGIIYQLSLICFFLSQTAELASGWDFFGMPGIRYPIFLFWARSKNPEIPGIAEKPRVKSHENPKIPIRVFFSLGIFIPGIRYFLVSGF